MPTQMINVAYKVGKRKIEEASNAYFSMTGLYSLFLQLQLVAYFSHYLIS